MLHRIDTYRRPAAAGAQPERLNCGQHQGCRFYRFQRRFFQSSYRGSSFDSTSCDSPPHGAVCPDVANPDDLARRRSVNRVMPYDTVVARMGDRCNLQLTDCRLPVLPRGVPRPRRDVVGPGADRSAQHRSAGRRLGASRRLAGPAGPPAVALEPPPRPLVLRDAHGAQLRPGTHLEHGSPLRPHLRRRAVQQLLQRYERHVRAPRRRGGDVPAPCVRGNESTDPSPPSDTIAQQRTYFTN